MRYRVLGKTALKVSEISFGGRAIGGPAETAGVPWGWGEVPEADAVAALQRARDCGVNFFDTADVYGDGRSEEMLAKAFAGHWDKLLVATKVGKVVGHSGQQWSRRHLLEACEASLRRLRKDAIDVYQLHNPDLDTIRQGDWPDTMETLRKQGKIRFYGVSVDTAEEALAFMERDGGQTIQLVYNALRQEMAKVFPLALKRNYGIIARVPLYYGVLTGKFTRRTSFAADDHRSHSLPPETLRELVFRASRLAELQAEEPAYGGNLGRWALKFVLSHHAVCCTIPGARNARQAEENCAASDGISLPKGQIMAARQMWEQDAYLRQLRTPL